MAYVKNTINPTLNLEYFVPKDYDGDGSIELKAYATTVYLKGEVCEYYIGSSGAMLTSASSGAKPYAVCKEAIASGEHGWIVVKGMAYGAHGGRDTCTATGFSSMAGYYVTYDSGFCATANSSQSSAIETSNLPGPGSTDSLYTVGIVISTYSGSDASTDYGYMINMWLPGVFV